MSNFYKKVGEARCRFCNNYVDTKHLTGGVEENITTCGSCKHSRSRLSGLFKRAETYAKYYYRVCKMLEARDRQRPAGFGIGTTKKKPARKKKGA